MKKIPAEMSDAELAVALKPTTVETIFFVFVLAGLFVPGIFLYRQFGCWGVVLDFVFTLIFIQIVMFVHKRLFKAEAVLEFYRRFPDLREMGDRRADARKEMNSESPPDFIILFQGKKLPGDGYHNCKVSIRINQKSVVIRKVTTETSSESMDGLVHETYALTAERAETLIQLLIANKSLQMTAKDSHTIDDGFPFEVCILERDTSATKCFSGNDDWTDGAGDNPAVLLVKLILER
jgi:hypothetical protein